MSAGLFSSLWALWLGRSAVLAKAIGSFSQEPVHESRDSGH
ncbi:hypothetical protein ACN4EG_08815 [Alkalinema pantanalense CENA528]